MIAVSDPALAILWVGLVGAGVILLMTATSRHRFEPDPSHPTQCRICGRRLHAHMNGG